MNHQDTKTPREPIPEETDEVVSKIVDAAFAVHTTAALIKHGVQRIAV